MHSSFGHEAFSNHFPNLRANVIPVLIYPEGSYKNDSTLLVLDLEKRHSERPVVPSKPVEAFLSALLEVDPLILKTYLP